MLDKLYKNAFQAIKIQLIPATGPIDRIPIDIGLDPIIRRLLANRFGL